MARVGHHRSFLGHRRGCVYYSFRARREKGEASGLIYKRTTRPVTTLSFT